MADFRTHSEQDRDEWNAQSRRQNEETDATRALKQLEPQIADYQEEVRRLQEQVSELKAENTALTEALKTQMLGVEEVKSFLVDRMDTLASDMDKVHRKVRGIAEDDMRLVELTPVGDPPAKLELGGYGRRSGSTGTECRSGQMGEARPFLGLEVDNLMSCVV